MPRTTPPDTLPRDTSTRITTRHDDTPHDTSLEALREQLTEAEKRAAVAEAELRGTRALVDEKQRTIDAQAHALRLLEPPRPAAPEPATETAPPEPETNPWVAAGDELHRRGEASVPEPPRRSWWQRILGK